MPRRPGQSFQEVLTEAIDDLVANGFDSVERLDRWTRELRAAAERSMISPASLEQALRDGLTAIYRRMVDQGGVIRFNPGIDRFTLERIKPALRSELDRRIAASANLIRLNRQQAIDKTLQRFQGWSTSIPAGGTEAASRSKTKADVRKSLAQLPFEERRVIIDQGHKLTAAISEIVASDGGAIACQWRSNFRQPGYDARPDHIERDGKFYLVRDSWAHSAGLVKKNSDGYYDEQEAVGQLPFCRCYAIWKFSLKELPEDMLTAKGRAALATVRARKDGGTSTGRADSADLVLTQRQAAYTPAWSNAITRCQRCWMFLRLHASPGGNACSAVGGDICAHGHCSLFEIGHPDYRSDDSRATSATNTRGGA